MGPRRAPEVRVVFDHNTTAPAVARGAVSDYLGDDPLRADLSLAASELVTNVVLHTANGGTFEMYDGSTVLLEVHDFDHTPPTRRLAGSPGGFGLGVVGALADAWGSANTPEGKVTWAMFNRKR